MEAIKALLKQITAFWEGKDKKFRRNVIIIASVVVAAIIISSILLNQVPYAVLYSGLEAEDSTAVLEALKEQKVAYRVSGDTILVPASEADSLRLSLSTEVKNGFNLDILKQGQGLGMTESDKQDYRRYQIQSDIRSSILTFKGVKDARVAITMPTESVLVIDNSSRAATAGVILTMESGMQLTAAQVNAIAQFVKNAVPGLSMDNISIMDSNMQNMDVSGTEDTTPSASDRYALQYDVQSKLRKQIMALLQPVFGIGSVEAQVNVTLGFDERTVDTVKFEPVVDSKNGIVVSIDKLREQIVNGTSTSGQPGTDANTGTGTTTYPVVNVDNGTYEKNAEKINYEINSIKEHLIEEKGAIKSLSVSVVIDNTDSKEDYTENVKNLVATAVGVDKSLISVEYLPMQGNVALTEAFAKDAEAQAASQKLQDMMPLIIAGGVLLLLVVGMMLLFGGRKSKANAAMAQQAAYLSAEAAASGELQQTDEQLDAIRIVKESGTKEQIGKLIKDNPELVANLLRSWLAEEE